MRISTPFDYTAFPAKLATEAKAIVADALALHRRTIEGQAEIGRRLVAIRERLEHGQFLTWIKAEFGGKSTAYRLMNVAENLVSELPTVGSLPAATVYELAAPTTPASVRAEIVGRLKAGEQIEPRKIENTVREARATDRAAKAETKLTPEEKKKREQKRKRQRRAAGQFEAEREERAQQHCAGQDARAVAAAEVIKILADRFSDEELRQLILVSSSQEHVASLAFDVLNPKSNWGWWFNGSQQGRDALRPGEELGEKLFVPQHYPNQIHPHPELSRHDDGRAPL